ncbi:integrase, catalytic region, zinc finger, CCHC-type containing protein [Tanacetum coccineum]
MILESVEHGLLIWPTVEENDVTRTKKYEELSATKKIQVDFNQQTQVVEFPQIDSSLVVPVFKQGDDPIDAINKMMSFLSTIVTSHFPTTNNQLRNSSNPRQQATIHDGRCLKPKRKRDATWFRDKFLLVEAQGSAKVLNEEELAFLADLRLAEGPVTQTVITHNAAYQADDLDAYDSDCDDFSTTKAVLIANLSSYGLDFTDFKKEINSLKQTLSEQLKEKESLITTFNVFKNESKEKEDKNIDKEIALEKKVKELDNIVYKMGQSAQTVHILTKPQVFYDNNLKQALGFQNPFFLKKAQQIKPMLYDSSVIANETNVISIADSEETLILKEESRSKMFLKQNFGKCFVSQHDLSDEQAFRLQTSHPNTDESASSPVKIEAPREFPKVVQIVLWYLDSGCSKHMTEDRSQLTNSVHKFLGTVKFGNDQIAKIMGYGDYQIGNIIISRVYYVEGLGHNLFSVGQFCDLDLEVAFIKHTFNGDLMASISNLFSCPKPQRPNIESMDVRLSHLNLVDINHLVKKWSRRVHMGEVLTSKDEAPDFIIKFLKMIQVRLNTPVRNIRTYNGTEFVNQTLRSYYESISISHETSVARSPQQNGLVERRNHTLVEAAQTMLIYAKAPLFLWAKTVATACYTQN